MGERGTGKRAGEARLGGMCRHGKEATMRRQRESIGGAFAEQEDGEQAG